MKRLKLLSGSFLAILLLVGCSKVSLEVKENTVEVEYGEKISLKAEDYLNNDETTLLNTQVKADIKNEDGKDYPSIGEYSISFIYNENEENKVDVKVVVKDTIAPKFKDIKEQYELENGKTISKEDFIKNVEDLSKVEITIDDSNVDYEKAGQYKAIFKATDLSKNEASKEINIVIKEKEEVANNIEESESKEVANNETSYQAENYTSSSNSVVDNSSNNIQPSQSTQPSQPIEPVQPVVEEPVVQEKNYNVGNSGMLFNTKEEARNYGESYMFEHIEEVGGYVLYSTYDKYTVNFDYY